MCRESRPSSPSMVLQPCDSFIADRQPKRGAAGIDHPAVTPVCSMSGWRDFDPFLDDMRARLLRGNHSLGLDWF